MTNNIRHYEQRQDGLWYLTYGGKPVGHNQRGYQTEQEIKHRLADWIEESEGADKSCRRWCR